MKENFMNKFIRKINVEDTIIVKAFTKLRKILMLAFLLAIVCGCRENEPAPPEKPFSIVGSTWKFIGFYYVENDELIAEPIPSKTDPWKGCYRLYFGVDTLYGTTVANSVWMLYEQNKILEEMMMTMAGEPYFHNVPGGGNAWDYHDALFKVSYEDAGTFEVKDNKLKIYFYHYYPAFVPGTGWTYVKDTNERYLLYRPWREDD